MEADSVAILRNIRDLATLSPDRAIMREDLLQETLRRLRRIKSLAGSCLSSQEGECGQFPWDTSAPHLRCVKPVGHEDNHRAEDGLIWIQKNDDISTDNSPLTIALEGLIEIGKAGGETGRYANLVLNEIKGLMP